MFFDAQYPAEARERFIARVSGILDKNGVVPYEWTTQEIAGGAMVMLTYPLPDDPLVDNMIDILKEHFTLSGDA